MLNPIRKFVRTMSERLKQSLLIGVLDEVQADLTMQQADTRAELLSRAAEYERQGHSGLARDLREKAERSFGRAIDDHDAVVARLGESRPPVLPLPAPITEPEAIAPLPARAEAATETAAVKRGPGRPRKPDSPVAPSDSAIPPVASRFD